MKARVAIFGGPMKEMEFREYPLPEVGPEDILLRFDGRIFADLTCISGMDMGRGCREIEPLCLATR